MAFLKKMRWMAVVAFKGGGRGVRRRKWRNSVRDWLNRLDFVVFGFFDRIDTRFLFKGRNVRTANGRVRSSYEARFVQFLRRRHVRYRYERKLVLYDRKLSLDARILLMLLYVPFSSVLPAFVNRWAAYKYGIHVYRPDFYLPRYKVYVEVWGMADFNEGYKRVMNKKLSMYRRHRIPVISVYPRHLRDLDSSFPGLFREATGKRLPER